MCFKRVFSVLTLGRYRVYRVKKKSVLVYTYVIYCVITNWGTHTCQPRNYWNRDHGKCMISRLKSV